MFAENFKAIGPGVQDLSSGNQKSKTAEEKKEEKKKKKKKKKKKTDKNNRLPVFQTGCLITKVSKLANFDQKMAAKSPKINKSKIGKKCLDILGHRTF